VVDERAAGTGRRVPAAFRTVVVTSGHTIDEPDRAEPRFPPALEPVVAAEIEAVLDGWGIGPGDLVLNGGARGADILFAESAHRRGADVELILASPPAEFEQTSVALPRSIWVPRFRFLRQQHGWAISARDPANRDEGRYARVNDDLIRRATELAPPAELRVALVWDGQRADGPGGTSDFAALAERLGAPLAVIDPTRL
jgi:hypothetical protein